MADETVLTAHSIDPPALQWSAGRKGLPPGFWIGLACAAAVHAVLILGLSRSSPRYLGDESGAPDAINVELVDEFELRDRSSNAASAQSPASAPSASVAPAAPAAPAPPPEPKTSEAPEPAPAQPSPAAEASKSETPQPAPQPEPQPQKSETKSQAKPELKPPANLDLSVPFDLTMREGSKGDEGRSSAVSRPPGITRSGENDRFGRDVIRALKKTMPDPHGIKGRVTIRLVLNERGNIADVRLVQSGGNRDLDQEIVFAAQQTSFPFPPKNASVVDRTFLVTYVYR